MKFFLLLDAAFASNRTFAAVLLGLILCLIVLILLALSRKGGKTEASARGGNGKTSRSAPAGGAPLMGALARERAEEPVKTVPAPQPQPMSGVDQKSIDKHYADQSGKWVCRYCETLNHNTLGYCQACGRPRS